jgi:uncharacterized damage-inducible protein DinB
MNRADFDLLFRYDAWANARLFTAAAALPEADLLRELGGSYKNLRAVLAHIVSGEWIWLQRWNGVNPSAAPDWVGSATLPELRERLTSVEQQRAAFLQRVSEETLPQTLEFSFLSGARGEHLLADLLMHVANHSTFHRGQAIHMLRQLGVTPPATDYIVFRAESKSSV